MSSKDWIVDPTTLDFDRVLADTEEIRKWNPQRFEMEQLTAIIHEDPVRNACVGYKEITDQEFWVRGHMPGMPLMPGVVMLEAVAQVCCYFAHKYDLLGTSMVGFGGLEEVRFRDPVVPGDRLVVMCELLKARRNRLIVCRFQGAVEGNLVLEGILKGIPIPVDDLKEVLSQKQSTRADR
ncbi:MAG: beta-hydroxyacyl-ACP dehydratase [Planctomycetota bacterium]|nr:beta-hydroxyacyl-ACP dehydratase [Planctomycetota bacterium]